MMPNTLQGVIDYARTHPTRDGGSWSGWCASFCYRAGGFERFFTNATAAGDASGWLNPDWRSAPAGALHYWAGVGGDGHVAFELGGGLLLMASGSTTDRWGTALGTVTFSDYAILGIPYRGWSLRWGSETLGGAGTAGGGFTTIQEDDMYDANARFEVVTRLDEIIQNQRNAATRQVTTYELVRTKDDPQVWFVVNRAHRIRVRDEATLKDYQYFITKSAGQNSTVKVVGNIDAFGIAAN